MLAWAMRMRISLERVEPTICLPPVARPSTVVGRISTVARAPGATSNNEGGLLWRAMKDPAGTVTLSPRPSSAAKRQEPYRIRCTSTRSSHSRAAAGRPRKRSL